MRKGKPGHCYRPSPPLPRPRGPPAAPRWPEALGSGAGGRAGGRGGLPGSGLGCTGIFIAPGLGDLPPPGCMQRVAAAAWGARGREGGILLQRLILGLGAPAGGGSDKSNTRGSRRGTAKQSEAERPFRAASAKQAVVRPVQPGLSNPTSCDISSRRGRGAWAKQVWAAGEAGPTLPVAPGLWLSRFLDAMLVQRVRDGKNAPSPQRPALWKGEPESTWRPILCSDRPLSISARPPPSSRVRHRTCPIPMCPVALRPR